MPRTNKIRWTKSQQEKLKKSVRSYNAKISRELKKNPQLEGGLPEKLSVRQLRKDIKTGKDLNQLVARTKRVFKKNAFDVVVNEKGVKTTKYEYHEVKLEVNRINRVRKKLREDADVSPNKGTMGTIEDQALQPKPFNFNKMEKRDWEKFKKGTRKMASDYYNSTRYSRYKENYIKALDILGEYGEPVKELVSKIDDEKFYKAQFDDPILGIQFISDPLEAKLIAEEIINHWYEDVLI